jgi:hypothetical protein
MATQQWVAIRRFILSFGTLSFGTLLLIIQRLEGNLVPPPPRGARQPARPDRSGRPDRTPTGKGERGGSTGRPGEDPRRPRFREPHLEDDVDYRELDRGVRAGLRSLPKDLAEKIGKHLVAAGHLLAEDPAAAVVHAEYARNLAPRLSVVREAYGVAAYHNGDYATALTELRAVRRMTGDPVYLPIMADSERGLAPSVR